MYFGFESLIFPSGSSCFCPHDYQFVLPIALKQGLYDTESLVFTKYFWRTFQRRFLESFHIGTFWSHHQGNHEQKRYLFYLRFSDLWWIKGWPDKNKPALFSPFIMFTSGEIWRRMQTCFHIFFGLVWSHKSFYVNRHSLIGSKYQLIHLDTILMCEGESTAFHQGEPLSEYTWQDNS